MGLCKLICSRINKYIKSTTKLPTIHIVDAPTISNASGLAHLSTVLPFESLLCHASQQYLNLLNDLKIEGIAAEQLLLPACKEVVDYCMDSNIGLIYLLSDPAALKWSNSKKQLNGALMQSRISSDDQHITIQSTLEEHNYSLQNLRAGASFIYVNKNLLELFTKVTHPIVRIICAPYTQKTTSNTLKHYYFSKTYSKSIHLLLKKLPTNSFLYTNVQIHDKLNQLYTFLRNSYLLYSLIWKWEGYADWIAIDEFISKHQTTLKQNPLMKETIESLPYTKQEICSLILSNQLSSKDYLVISL